jgi:hypothetical protein
MFAAVQKIGGVYLFEIRRRGTAMLSACYDFATIRSHSRRISMRGSILALAVAAFSLVAISSTTQAAPIAPLSAAVASDHGNLTQVHWHHRRCWWHHGHRHCRHW